MLTAKLPEQIVDIEYNKTKEDERECIDWNLNYGKTFKIIQMVNNQEPFEDSTMIVTQDNISNIENWNNVSEKTLCKIKKNWNIIQKNLSEYKYKQIISCIKNFGKSSQ